jgi:hypothetical protein
MTLYAEIQALPSAASLLAAGNYHDIAAAVSVGRVRRSETLIGPGSVQNTLGPDAGGTVLSALEAASASSEAIKWGMVSLLAGKLDVALASTRGMLDTIATAGLMSQAQADALKALAPDIADPVGWEACLKAIEQGA